MGDYCKDHPDAIGTLLSIVATFIMKHFQLLEGALLAAPAAIGYAIALALSSYLIKKQNKEATDEYEKKLSQIKNSKYKTLESMLTLNQSPSKETHDDSIGEILRKTAEDINKIEEMEMEDLFEKKKAINEARAALKENGSKFSSEIKNGFK